MLWIIKRGNKSSDKWPYKKHTEKRHTEWKSQMKKESEIGVVQPQAKGCQQCPGAGEGMQRLLALEHMISDFWPPKW